MGPVALATEKDKLRLRQRDARLHLKTKKAQHATKLRILGEFVEPLIEEIKEKLLAHFTPRITEVELDMILSNLKPAKRRKTRVTSAHSSGYHIFQQEVKAQIDADWAKTSNGPVNQNWRMEQWAKRWNALDDNGQNQFNERWRNERMLQKIIKK